MIEEFEAGAAELDEQIRLVATLRGRVEKWRGVAAKRARRIKRLETQLGFYKGSRLLRLTERIVRKARRIRSRR
jgi:hypothetical protein